MNHLKEKLKLIFIPFLVIAVLVIVGYTFLNWLLIANLQLFSVKEMIVNFWIPFLFPFIPVYIWLRPRIKRLSFNRKKGDPHFGYVLLASLAIAAPTIISQHWMEKSTGTLVKLENIKQIEEQNSSKYYALKTFYIDKNHFGLHPSFEVSGKYNRDFDMHLFISLPILENEKDTMNSVCFAWLGKEYKKTISNKLDEQEKEKLYLEFLEESQDEFDRTDFNQFVYLKRLGNTDASEGYQEAIKQCLKFNSLHSDTFLAVDEPFENRAGSSFGWIFGALGIGSGVWLLLLLSPKLIETKVEESTNEVSPPAEIEKNEALNFFLPREGFYITPIIMDLNILIFLIMAFSGLGFISFDAAGLIPWGANIKPITTDGEWYRLLTSTFLHGGLMHLLANMYGLVFVGIFLEPILGKKRYAIIYLVTGVIASIASLYIYDNTVSVGASGAIFGLYGVFLALLLRKVFPADFGKSFLTSTLIFIGYNLLAGFANTGTDNAAHIGGLVSGFIIGMAISSQIKKESEELASGNANENMPSDANP